MQNLRKVVLSNFILTTITMAQFDPSAAMPPVAKKIAKTDVLHGETRVDHYYWLRGKSSPEVISYLEAENSYMEAVMRPTKPLQETIYNEILKRTKQTDLSVPYRLGEYWYYTRTEEGKQYAIYCRKKGSMEATEQVVLELNELAKGHKFLGLGLYQVTNDGNLLAYSLDTTGFRQYQLRMKDMTDGSEFPDSIGQVNSAVWAADNKTLFYVKEDHAKRPYRLFKHVLGSKNDESIYEEKDELYRIGVYRSNDKKYIFLGIGSLITSEIRYLPSDKPTGQFKIILARDTGHEYDIDHRDGLLYIRSNKNAKNFRLVTAPVDNPQPNNWKELIAHRPEVKIEGFDLFKNNAVVTERDKGLLKIKVLDFRTGRWQNVDFPEPVYTAFPANNPEYDTKLFRFNYQSFITPSSVYDYDMESEKRTLLKQTEVLGGYDPSQYDSERIYAKSADGTMVPISLVYKKGLKRDGSSQLYLYGYGSYGASSNATFSIPRLSLLDRGVIYAIGHIRGGGDLGEQWREDGKMMKKKNTFTDFIVCAEHLIQKKYTSAQRLVIDGRSAGGLLIGAVLNMRPDLFKAAHAGVPFVDVINTMLDESVPLTVAEFVEWGNPKKKDEYAYMRTYSPYDNIEAKAYPDMLVTTSLNDSQVMYWEPAKYVAKMRALRKDKNVLVMRCNMGAGHGGASGRYDAFKETALIYAFLLNSLGITK
ncbi:MAG: S9 family peptidase [Ignavibacteriales bacterium]|nr:S9 family peptidase [Ignavibacteriales bacterium]